MISDKPDTKTLLSDSEIIEELNALNKLPLSAEHRGGLLAAWCFNTSIERKLAQRGQKPSAE